MNFRHRTTLSSSTSTVTSTARTDDKYNSPDPLGLQLLHAPLDPQVDIVFVHGLGGGSRKTWSKTSSISHYWPQEWLPMDHAFSNARIHSFGYDSNWAKGRANCLNIHHIGKLLLAEITTSPYLSNSSTSIIFVGHSMGGLVIKKAHILASQCADHKDIAARIHSIYFLATPHRGSDSASTLSSLLQAFNSTRGYVTDLERGSGAIQLINDEFRNYCTNIKICSFYETQKLRLVMTSSLIVDPESATLGYPQEEQIPTNADHRSICKFESPLDPTYQSLRNALASTVKDVKSQGTFLCTHAENMCQRSPDPDLGHRSELRKYLNAPQDFADDLSAVKDARLQGTCEWFVTKENYIAWSDPNLEAPYVLCITGRPAAGKSVLAGYIIEQLLEKRVPCSYFFFQHGNKSKSQLVTCLRSLAYQMARGDVGMRNKLFEVPEDDRIGYSDNERTIWRKLIRSGILHNNMATQYWVIDALDECSDTESFFDPILANLDSSINLRVLITSRQCPDLAKKMSIFGSARVQQEMISASDTLPDIRNVVQAKTRLVSLKSEEDRVSLMDKILEKAEGSFLWTNLVLVELARSYSDKDIHHALNSIPPDIDCLYHRIIGTMARSGRSNLSKAILTWTICVTRPLTVKELTEALKIDMDDSFAKLEETIMATCGHLVTVDKLGRVQMIHGTAREFLLQDSLDSEFAIKKMAAHTRIAKVCLTYLVGEEMRSPRGNRRGLRLANARRRSDLMDYVCTAFSYHLARSDPLANDVLSLVDSFLRSNVLTWIEAIATTRNLMPMIYAARDLRTYFNSCAIQRSPLGTVMQAIREWSSDLIRLVAKFSGALTSSPSAIYTIIPPFCPSDSAIHNVRSPGRQLSINGLTRADWDDRLSCINFRERQASSVTYGPDYLAVGLTNGTIFLYHATTCQEYKTLAHGEAVRILQFRPSTNMMASCGMKSLRIWDTNTAQTVYDFPAPQKVLDLAFDKDFLVAASSKETIAKWDLGRNGARQPDRNWAQSDDADGIRYRGTPCSVSISIRHKMLAAGYGGRPIALWDMADDAFYGECGKKWSNGDTSTMMVTALAFNPNPNIELLAASYLDGELVLLDPFNDAEVTSFRAHLVTLESSPDGRLLAGGSGGGLIQIYDFETLTLLYRVKSSSFLVKQLAFSKDSLRFADVRGSHCNVWDPAVVLGSSVNDSSSQTSVSSLVDATTSDTKVKIITMVLHPAGEYVFCGKDDGTVSSYSVKNGAEGTPLYRHKSLVRSIIWVNQSDSIVSIDASNGIIGWQLKPSLNQGWVTGRELFHARLDSTQSVNQAISSQAANIFLLSTRQSDYLWILSGQQESARSYMPSHENRRWIQHPTSLKHLICVQDNIVCVHRWETWKEVLAIATNIVPSVMEIKNTFPFALLQGRYFLFEMTDTSGSPDTKAIQLLNVDMLSLEGISLCQPSAITSAKEVAESDMTLVASAGIGASASFSHQLEKLAPRIIHIIGLRNKKDMVFLDKHSWVCSVDLEAISKGTTTYTRHYFVPYDWFAGTRALLCGVIQKHVIFARHSGVAVIRGFEYAEAVDFESERPST